MIVRYNQFRGNHARRFEDVCQATTPAECRTMINVVTDPTCNGISDWWLSRVEATPVPGWVVDPRCDADNHIDRVEAADGQALETATRDAMNQLFLDLKAAADWPLMDYALAGKCGARTLKGRNAGWVPPLSEQPTGID